MFVSLNDKYGFNHVYDTFNFNNMLLAFISFVFDSEKMYSVKKV